MLTPRECDSGTDDGSRLCVGRVCFLSQHDSPDMEREEERGFVKGRSTNGATIERSFVHTRPSPVSNVTSTPYFPCDAPLLLAPLLVLLLLPLPPPPPQGVSALVGVEFSTLSLALTFDRREDALLTLASLLYLQPDQFRILSST